MIEQHLHCRRNIYKMQSKVLTVGPSKTNSQPFNNSKMMQQTISRVLEPPTMYPLQIERETVEAGDVFHDQRVWKSLQEYSKTLHQYEKSGEIPDSVTEINCMAVPGGYVPEDLSHQDLTGRQVMQQAKLIAKAAFFNAVASHPDYKELPGYEKQRRIMRELGWALNLLRRFGNLFRKEQIHTLLGSPTEIKIAQQCFGTLWPAGINLYAILRDLYPAFHARITGQVPVWVAKNMENLLDSFVDRKIIHGLGRFTIDYNGRFLGLYPVAEVPRDQVTLDASYFSQDQIGRRAIAKRMLDDAIKILQRDQDQRIIAIDYAGGPGNISELLLKQIYGLPESDIKVRLKNQIRVAVIDIEDDQLAAGRKRFDQMSQKSALAGINDKIAFFKADVTKPLGPEQLKKVRGKFSAGLFSRVTYLGMTSYTIGALDNLCKKDGTTYAEAMADEMFKQCWKIYAADFSSPMWRVKSFLRDTGSWGKEYLRAIHGVADQQDEKTPLNSLLARGLGLRYGLKFNNVADFVRFMALGPGLASHYATVWPDSDGHNAGYTVIADGTLKKPSFSQSQRTTSSSARSSGSEEPEASIKNSVVI